MKQLTIPFKSKTVPRYIVVRTSSIRSWSRKNTEYDWAEEDKITELVKKGVY